MYEKGSPVRSAATCLQTHDVDVGARVVRSRQGALVRFNYVLTIGAFTTATMAALAQSPTPQQGYGAKPELPPPSASAIKFVKVVGWPAGKTPTAPNGFTVTEFGANLDHPRWLYALPNGDILVAEASTPPKPAKSEKEQVAQEGQKQSKAITPSQNRISLLRDANAWPVRKLGSDAVSDA